MNESDIRACIGEILIAGFDGTKLTSHARTLITKHKVRNIILFSRNVQSMQQVRQLNAELQKLAQTSGDGQPLLICTDQENGIVRRLAPGLPGLPGNMALGAIGNEEFATAVGRATAYQLKSAGVNMNLGPVLDVNNNPENPVIGVRSFGEDPNLVARLGVAMIQAMQEAGVAACAKHFPGHGDTATDSHLSLPRIEHARDRLDAVEFMPFQAAIAAGIDIIMSAHVIFPSVEPRPIPVTLSRAVLTGLLREELGFQGVISTDCLEMNAISETIGIGEGAVQAVLAGADMVMVSHRLDRQEDAIESLVQATLAGRIPTERLLEAASRVRQLRTTRLLGATLNDFDIERLSVEATALADVICPQAITVVKNAQGLYPVDGEKLRNVCVLMDDTEPMMSAADPIHAADFLATPLRRKLPEANVTLHVIAPDGPQLVSMAELQQADLIVAGLNGIANQRYLALLRDVTNQNWPIVVISLQSPYDLAAVPSANTTLAMYECTPWMADAAVSVLLDLTRLANTRMPITLA